MKRKPPPRIEVVIDDREQEPYKFRNTVVYYSGFAEPPLMLQVDHKKEEFKYGDYFLRQWPRKCGIERKKNTNELHQNLCTKDRHRFLKALDRFADWYEYPLLMFDGSTGSFNIEPIGMKSNVTLRHRGTYHANALLGMLMEVCIPRGIQVIPLGRNVHHPNTISNYVLQTMLSYNLYEKIPDMVLDSA
jgi:hypothetical protein